MSPQASNLIFISPKLLCNANCSIFRARRVAGAHFQCTGHGIGNSLSLRSAPCHAGVEVSHGIRSRAPFLRACLCSVSSAKEKKETWQALIPSAWMCCDRLQAQALRAVCVPIFSGIFCFSSTSPQYPSAGLLRAQIADSQHKSKPFMCLEFFCWLSLMNLLLRFPTVQKLPPGGNGNFFPAAHREEKEELHHMNDSLPSLFPGEAPPGGKPPLRTPARCQGTRATLPPGSQLWGCRGQVGDSCSWLCWHQE